jgi:hypothetical protein
MKKFAMSIASLAVLAAAATAGAAPIIITGTNGTQAATAEVTLSNDTVKIKITNDTATTHDAGDLLTKFTLSIAGVTDGTVTAGTTAKERTVNDDGSFSTINGPFNVIATGVNPLNTWMGSFTGGLASFEFHPNAQFGLLGAPTGGDYSGANGSIGGNSGHNPFAYGDVTFTFNVPGVTKDSHLGAYNFYFGTDFQTDIPGGGVPEPASLGILSLGGVALLARRKRRIA